MMHKNMMLQLKKLGAIGLLRITPWEKVFGGLSTGKIREHPAYINPEAVDQALCFGWVDRKPNKRDNNIYYHFFSKRNPKNTWSGINKIKWQS